MPSVSEIIRGARRRDPEAAAPPPRRLLTEYVTAVGQFVEAARRGDQWAKIVSAQALHEIRRAAAREGFAERLEAVWVKPETTSDARWLSWFEKAVAHKLNGAPSPGERPPQVTEWPYWAARYRERCDALVTAYKSGVPGVIADEEGRFWNLPKEATTLGGFHDEVARHFMGVPVRRGENWIEQWWEEAGFRLQHGRPSGTYVQAPPHEPFVRRLVDVIAADYSYVILLSEHDDHPVGARVRLDAGTSHQLVEAGQAAWCDPATIPNDPRPPVETEPAEDWPVLHFLKQARLRSRHPVGPGVVRPVPPGEAQQLVANGIAERYVPPPPPPPAPIVLFE